MTKKCLKAFCFALAFALCVGFSACDMSGTGGLGNSILDNSIGSSQSSDDQSNGDQSSNSGAGDNVEDSSGSGSGDSSGGGVQEIADADFDVHFLQLGNKVSGDCTLIDIGDTEILIDAGSRTGSIGTIVPYIKKYCTDGILEYVIVTHAHQDHIAGFTNSSSNGQGVFDNFVCQTIIDFPKTTVTSNLYKDYVALRDAEVASGATHYTALECWNNANGAQRSYDLGGNVSLDILYQKYYEQSTSEENNNSVCVMVSQGKNHYLFTGDLESSGEASLVENNALPKCKLFKSGHHGSNTSNSDKLLSVIQPEIFVLTCCCGDSYGFPHQETINTVAQYTDLVYAPLVATASAYELLNGNIVVQMVKGKVSVQCSNNNTLFKDTDWFKNNRVTPDAWK